MAVKPKRESRRRKVERCMGWVVSVQLLLQTIGFFGLGLHFRLLQGVWPKVYARDPDSIGYRIHEGLVLVGIPLTLLGLISLALAVGIARLGEVSPWRLPFSVRLAAGLLVGCIFLATLDINGLTTWGLD
jgi:hypothetical protein